MRLCPSQDKHPKLAVHSMVAAAAKLNDERHPNFRANAHLLDDRRVRLALTELSSLRAYHF